MDEVAKLTEGELGVVLCLGDQARGLLRPGRFDRRVSVSAPDLSGRRQILEVRVRGVPLAPDVDLAEVAASTPGMAGGPTSARRWRRAC